MAHSEARAWWADVQHLKDGYERTDEARRRADEADLAARRAIRERRGVEAEVSSLLSAPRRTPAAADAPPRRTPGAAAAPPRRTPAAAAAPPGRVSGPQSPPRHATEPEPARAPRRGGPADAHDVERPRGPHAKGSAKPGRRTVEIRGRTVPAPAVPYVEADRRRPPRRAIERVGGRPDRVAMWALLMGLLLILVAIGTADGPAVVALMLH